MCCSQKKIPLQKRRKKYGKHAFLSFSHSFVKRKKKRVHVGREEQDINNSKKKIIIIIIV